MRQLSDNRKTWGISLLIGLVLYQIMYGFHTLNPTNINWMMSAYHDWGQHYLGFAFYRADSWHFPLGVMENIMYPNGTNVGFMDSIPGMAFIFKIFSPILPENFQYFGFWLLSCHVLVAYYSVGILRLYNVNWIVTVLAACVICANPVLAFRGMHPSLCAHWLLIGSLYHYLLPPSYDAKKVNRSQILLFFLAGTISPYLTFMVAGFSVAIPIKHYFFDKSISWKQLVLYPVAGIASVIAFWIVFGMIEFGGEGTNLDVGDIYGMYAMNLDSFLNSFGFFSHYLPSLGMVSDRQHEGFAYFGLGMIVLFPIALATFAYFMKDSGFRRRSKRYIPIFVIFAIFAIFAISNKVSWRTDVIFEYPTLGIVKKLGNIFRAIGRFIWPAYYAMFLFTFVMLSKIRIPKAVTITVIALFAVLQFYDTENILTMRKLGSGDFHTKVDDAKWIKSFSGFDEIISYPAFTDGIVYDHDYQDLCFLALRAHKPISAGYSARENVTKSQEFRDTLSSQMQRGFIPKGRLFVTNPKYLDDFQELIRQGKIKISKENGYVWLYATGHDLSVPSASAYGDSIARYYRTHNGFRQLKTPPIQTNAVAFNLEDFRFENNLLTVRGWAYDKEKSQLSDSIFMALRKDNVFYAIGTRIVPRPDLTTVFRKPLDSSGFNASFFAKKLPKASYELGILIKGKDGRMLYTPAGRNIEIGLSAFKKPSLLKSLPMAAEMMGNVEIVETKGDAVKISGWAALENRDSDNLTIRLVLAGSAKNYTVETDPVNRVDVTTFLKRKFNNDNSGFVTVFKKKTVAQGSYKIGVILKDTKTGKEFYKLFGKPVDVKN